MKISKGLIFMKAIKNMSELQKALDKCIKKAMAAFQEICNAFLFAHKEENADIYEQICSQMKDIVLDGDRSNGSVDSSLTSSKRALIVDAVEKITYSNYHLTSEQREAFCDGYIYSRYGT